MWTFMGLNLGLRGWKPLNNAVKYETTQDTEKKKCIQKKMKVRPSVRGEQGHYNEGKQVFTGCQRRGYNGLDM